MEKHAFLNQQQKREIFDLKGKNQINFGHPQQLQFASSNVEPKNNIPVNNMNRLAGQLDPSYKEHQQIKQYNALIPNFKRDPLTDLLFNLLIKQSDNKEIQSSDQIVSAQELIVRGQKIKKTMEQTWGDVFTEVCKKNKITPTQEMIDIFAQASTQKLLEDGNAKKAFDMAYDMLSCHYTYIKSKETQDILRKQFFSGLLKQSQLAITEKEQPRKDYHGWLLHNCKNGINMLKVEGDKNIVIVNLSKNKNIQNIIDIIDREHDIHNHKQAKIIAEHMRHSDIFSHSLVLRSIKDDIGNGDSLNFSNIFTNKQVEQYLINYIFEKHPIENRNFMEYQAILYQSKEGFMYHMSEEEQNSSNIESFLFTRHEKWLENEMKNFSDKQKLAFLNRQLNTELNQKDGSIVSNLLKNKEWENSVKQYEENNERFSRAVFLLGIQQYAIKKLIKNILSDEDKIVDPAMQSSIKKILQQKGVPELFQDILSNPNNTLSKDDILDISFQITESILFNKQSKQGNGLTSDEYKQIRNKKIGITTKKCVFCSFHFEKDEAIKELSCRHIFHSQCIKDWFTANKKCPLVCCQADSFILEQVNTLIPGQVNLKIKPELQNKVLMQYANELPKIIQKAIEENDAKI